MVSNFTEILFNEIAPKMQIFHTMRVKGLHQLQIGGNCEVFVYS